MNPIPVPPPSRRQPRSQVDDLEARCLRLLEESGRLYEALACRSSADFRPVPIIASSQDTRLCTFFAEDGELPASLVGELAEHLSPRLERLHGNLRRRLTRARAEVPLARVRELDPVCMRVNAVRAGRTIVEKAGPRQQLVAVVRVERFDTVENRVLIATSRRIARDASAILQQAAGHERRKPRVRALRRLLRAAQAILERTELAAVTGPRPGDQPSNALLGDRDYRAVWRTHRLLLEQEERFAFEWRAVADVRRELALAAAWSVFADSSLPELPNSLLVLRDRDSGHRLQTLTPRTWIRVDEQQVEEYAVIPTRDGIDVVARRFGTSSEERRLEVDVRALGGEPGTGQDTVSEASPHRDGQQLLSELRPKILELVGALPEKPFARKPHHGVGFVGISGLDRQLRVASAHGVDVVDLTAALELEHGASRLVVFGASAAWGHGTVGPAGLHSLRAELGGQLLASKRPAGAKGVAVVVPDRADDVSLRVLRSHLGRAWFVWQPVAVALASADQLPATRHLRALVIALSDTVDDVTILTCDDPGSKEACWLRDTPLPVQPWSLEADVLHSVEHDADVLAAWIRATRDAETVWVRHPEGFRRKQLPAMREARLRALDTALAAGNAEGFDVVILAGDPAVEALVKRRTKRPVILLPEGASAVGARIFLERHAADLPTWKDRLPHLAIEVNENRMRAFVDIVPKNQWAKPGQVLTFDSATQLTLRAGAKAVDLRLSKDEQSVPYSLTLEGRPFPLAKPVEVRTHVRFEYGIEDIQGEFRPADPAPFHALAFRWSAGASPSSATDAAPPCIPAYREPGLLSTDSWQAILKALQGLTSAWTKLDQRTRTKAATQVLPDAQLQPELQRLVHALRTVRGSGPATITKQQRGDLEQHVARRLEWLLGIASSPARGDGRAPRLANRTRLLVLQARGQTRVRGANDKKLLTLLRDDKNVNEALLALGRIIDGKSDHALEQLMSTETRTNSLRRRFGEAVREALASHPALAPNMSADQALQLLDRLVGETEALDRSPNMRTNFAQLLLAIPQLCRARTTGALPLDVTAPYVLRLRQLRAMLPPEILKHAEGSDTRDEPLSMAVDALEGREVNLPIVEVA